MHLGGEAGSEETVWPGTCVCGYSRGGHHSFVFKITTWALKDGIGWDGSDMGLPSKGSRKNS